VSPVKKISTVFFDFGDTLVEGNPTYLRRITELLDEFGFRREHADVVSAFTKADYLLYRDMRSGSLGNDGEYLMGFLDHLGQCLDITIDWEAALPQILERFEERPYERVLVRGASETLEALTERGYRLGIISNNDGRCRAKCEELGIDTYFEIIIDSTLEAVRKPSPRIFHLALDRMEVPADGAAHVGDMYGSDVMGARDVGITPVWYNPRRCEPFADYQPAHDIERLEQMLEMF